MIMDSKMVIGHGAELWLMIVTAFEKFLKPQFQAKNQF